MGVLFLNSFSCAPNKPLTVFDNYMHKGSSLRKKKSLISCQGSGNKIKNSGVSSVLTERSPSTLANTDNAALMDSGNLVFSRSEAENIAKKEMVNYGRKSSTSLVEIHDGIGIVKFLRGKCFLITGATGFLAKVLIEKILWTVPDVGKIYLLIKANNKEAAMGRLKNEIINSELFKRLQKTHGKSYQAFMLEKLVPVVGNVCKSDIGLEEELAEKMAKEVDVIVNSSANTTFDERYDVALDINTRGPGHLMGFAKKCKKLKLFLQVSTAYVNGERQGRIMEKPFCIGESIAGEINISGNPPNFLPTLDVEGEINLAFTSNKAFQNNATQKMKDLGLERAKKYGWQDTYVFTKAMGEMMIDNVREGVPVVIIRPSVIESTLKEPFPGWMEGIRMMDPIVLYYGKGQLTGFIADPNGILDVVPADMVVNAMLAAIAKHGVAQKPDINIYQIASSVVNPLFQQDLSRMFYEHYNSSPCMDSNGRPIQVSPMKLFPSIEDFASHLWRDTTERSGLAAMVSSNQKKSQKLEVICKKSVEQAKHLATIYKPYAFYGGRFDNSNAEKLMESMCEEEKRQFGFDVGRIDWSDYITNVHIPGLRRHVMKGRATFS
ncbi:fatty acyl-CoA reductase 2, chloroplastic [Ziziphus jujuba]|uniref:Fatty acyl-CoA reductase n=1 Tax=Ziziphus jujuba TaxID=326968 RepID=A0ABM3I6G7_ZIZJJ|nr:fatty acyl-CoA reductase 2, chloroplastic [Ziziphus jujuba]